jgi:hypothetical protein
VVVVEVVFVFVVVGVCDIGGEWRCSEVDAVFGDVRVNETNEDRRR